MRYIFGVDFVSTLPSPSGAPTHEILALDCEMVRQGPEFRHSVVFDISVHFLEVLYHYWLCIFYFFSNGEVMQYICSSLFS